MITALAVVALAATALGTVALLVAALRHLTADDRRHTHTLKGGRS